MHLKLFLLAFWTLVFYVFILILHTGKKLVVFYTACGVNNYFGYTDTKTTVNTVSAAVASFTLVSLVGWRAWKRRKT